MAAIEGVSVGGGRRGPALLGPQAREAGLGALFWCAILLVLEPGNVVRAINAGAPLAWEQELVRIAGASLLGGACAPLQFWLARRFPTSGLRAWGHIAIHAAACIGLALILLTSAHVLARVILPADNPWVVRSFGEQFAMNVLLLVAGTSALSALIHLRRKPAADAKAGTATSPYLTRIAAEGRDGARLVEIADIDWIESQGNYVAIHENGAAPLVRATLASLEAQLDPSRFLRIHRRTIVNVSRLKELTTLANGDALVRLADGTALRASRTYGKALREAFGRGGSASTD